MDLYEFSDRQAIKQEITPVLRALREAGLKYAVWGAAATCFHGGRWLWRCQDYEVAIDDWFDGARLRLAVDAVTVRCSDSWEYDTNFDEVAWAESRGDRPLRPGLRRFKHPFDGVELGVILVPAESSVLGSMHHDDLVDDDDPIWVYPSLKNLVQSQIRQWRRGRNSALLDLVDLAGARRLRKEWADEVGLELSRERRLGRVHEPSDWEIWEEVARMALTNSDRQRATARFAARRAAKEVRRVPEVSGEEHGVVDG